MTRLAATFIADTEGPYQGLYRGARCELPSGEAVEVMGRRVPLYDLARELDARGWGACRLQAHTPDGTPSLRGRVSVLAGLTVKERDHGGLRLEPFQKFPGRPQDAPDGLFGRSGPREAA